MMAVVAYSIRGARLTADHRPLRAAASLASLALVCALPVAAQTPRADCERAYTPQRAQEGKDVIWVPTEDAMVERMLELANVTAADKVYDLGAGDGKIAIAAGKRGATAVGIEYTPELATFAQCLVVAEGLADRVRVVQGDIFEADFGDATVVLLYLFTDLNIRLRPTLLGLTPGTRVVSNSFRMGDWEPDETAETNDGSAYLWIVPAKAGGEWTFRSADGADRFDVTLEQTYQTLHGGSGGLGGASVRGVLRGEAIVLTLVLAGERAEFAGVVAGNRIAGTLTRAGEAARHYVATPR